MKKKSLISRCRLGLGVALRYWWGHAASLKATKRIYSKAWPGEKTGDQYSVTIKISPNGSLYRVTQSYYVNGTYRNENTWLASYGWHSNGHLISLGRTCYLIFDPLQKLLYLEDFPDEGERTVDIYKQV
ncbi:MAG TPA: hypothetical protein DCO83_02705 [Mucilaginibacter sp.]|jgi:hypothetical protein|nr:hypothetical protein [Mucilaginibacter sp.]